MGDMSSVIIPKSDQWNADDFLAGPKTFTIRDVQIKAGEEQPVNILLEGSDKAFRPCKSMSRCLVSAWGADARKYVGRSLTLYRDPTVKWAGIEVGGIRISHMSDIDGPKKMMLTATRGSRKPHQVLPLQNAPERPQERDTVDPAVKWSEDFIERLAGFQTGEEIEAFVAERQGKLAELKEKRPDLHERVNAAIQARCSTEPQSSSFDDDDLQPQQSGGAYDGA